MKLFSLDTHAGCTLAPACSVHLHGWKQTETLGYRLRNPGCIRARTSTRWVGQAGCRQGNFVCFLHHIYGLRAIYRILRTYSQTGASTPVLMLHRWAPHPENDIQAYLDHASEHLDIYRPIHWSRAESLVAVICRRESQLQFGPAEHRTARALVGFDHIAEPVIRLGTKT